MQILDTKTTTEVLLPDKDVHRDKGWYYCTILYLIVEYGRPQDIIPIGFLKPGMISNGLLIFYILRNSNMFQIQVKQVQMIWMFIGLLILFIPFAVNNNYAYQTAKGMLLFMPFILSIIAVVNSMDRLRKMIYLLIFLMAFNAFNGILHKGMGLGNYFADENDLALYINMWLPLCFFLLQAETRKLLRIGLIACFIAGLAGNVISMSRGGFLSLAALSFVCWLKSPKKLLGLAIFFFLGIGFYFYAGETYWKEMGTIWDSGSGAERIWSWKAAWKMFLDNPLGVGGNNFQVRFEEYQGEWFQRAMWGRVAHSLWFTLLPELGIAGVFIYLFLLYYNLRDIRSLAVVNVRERQDMLFFRYMSYAYLGSLVGFFSAGSFLSVLYYPHYWYLTALIVATVRTAGKLA